MINLNEQTIRNYIIGTRLVFEQLKQTSFAKQTTVSIGLIDDVEMDGSLSKLCEVLIEIADDLLEE